MPNCSRRSSRASGAFAGLALLATSVVSPAFADPPAATSPDAVAGGQAASAAGATAAGELPMLELIDLAGMPHRLGGGRRGSVTVIVFLSTTCPIANAALGRLDAVAPVAVDTPAGDSPAEGDRAADDVRIFGVVSERALTRAEAVAHFEERPTRFPILFDASGSLREALAPTHVPEAFLFDRSGRLAYRGAIDDAYAAVGRRRPGLTRQYLADAIAATRRGTPPAVAFVPPVGCVLDPPQRIDTSHVTYARDIAPMVSSRCVSCHRPGGGGPFSLTSAAEAAAVAPMLVEVTRKRIMPPWPPLPDAAHPLVGERWLSDAEIELFARWAAAGSPPGDDADLPPPAAHAEGWRLGEPDLVVRMPEPFTVPADGPDVFRNFVIPLEVPTDRVVAAIEFHPGEPRVVHHAVLFLDESGSARRLDAADPQPGYEGFGGPGFLPSGALGGWSVGNTPRRLPGGRGRYLRKGSDLVVQVHYHPDGVERTDLSEIGIFFIDEPLSEFLAHRQRLVGSIWTANYRLDIPADDADYEATARYRLPRAVTLVGVVPHMHLLGRAVRVRAEEPDGRRRVILDIPAWNYAWQDEYLYERPFLLPAGTELVVEAAFDNSAGNPSNPSSPPRRVTWGDGTRDEMLFCFFLISADSSEDLLHVVLDNLGHDLRQPRGTP
jgi:hypothetical protein